MYDANLVLQALVTKTTAFAGTGIDLKTGTPRRGLKVRLIVSSYISAATAGSVITPYVDHSDDNTTFTRLTDFLPITGGTAAVVPTAPYFRTVETSKRYIRGGIEISPSSGTPSISYLMDISLARP